MGRRGQPECKLDMEKVSQCSLRILKNKEFLSETADLSAKLFIMEKKLWQSQKHSTQGAGVL